MLRLSALALLFGLAAPARLAAQDEGVPWRISNFPYLMGDPTSGLLVIGHLQYARQADYDARAPFDGYAGLEGALGTSGGSRFLAGKIRIPNLAPGWRLAFDAAAVRQGKFGYYGQGEAGEGAGVEGADALRSDAFRVRRTRYYARAEVTRRIAGPLHAAASLGVVRYRYSALDESVAFRTDFFDTPLSGSDATGRLALVLDTRNSEFVPENGLLLEAGIWRGTGRFEERNLEPGGGGSVASFSGRGYTGAYAHLRGYVSPRVGTVFAARAAIRALGPNAPLDARYEFPGWERDLSVLGGADSHRGHIRGRFLGRGLLFTALEARHNLIDLGDYGAVTLLAFLDAGRAFDGKPRLSFDGFRVGGGGGFALRITRLALLSFHFARGSDGFTFSMSNGWAF
jgi:hypothetical protein